MRIAEIIPSLYPVGGAEKLVLYLSKALIQNGHEVFVLSLYSENDNEIVRELEKLNVKLVFLSKRKGIDFGCAKRLKKALRAIRPEVIHSHLDSLVTLFIARAHRIAPVFYTIHTLISERSVGKKRSPKNLLYKLLFSRQIVVPVAISKIVKEAFCGFYNIRSSNVPIVKNGVPTDTHTATVPFARRRNDFVFVGRFIRLKNPEIIVSAFLRVKQTFPSLTLLMIGDGPLLDSCKSIVTKSRAEGVCFTGFVNDVHSYLAQSKVLVLASEYEGNPLAINEAIASGCYVLSTNVGGVPDIVNEHNGMLLDASQELEENLVKAMSWCAQNVNAIEKKLAEAFEANVQKVSISQTMSDYLTLFALSKRRSSRS